MAPTNLPVSDPPGDRYGCPTDAEGPASRGLRFRQLFRDCLAGSRVGGTGTAPGAIGPAAHCHSLFSPEVHALCLPKVQGARMGRGWAPDGMCPQSWFRRHGFREQGHGLKAEGAEEKRRRGTWVSQFRTVFFLPAKPSSLADIPSRDEPCFRLWLVLKENKG